MAVLTLASAAGAPGVTTTALGLALAWPRRVLLADCDRDPSRALLAGYLRGQENPSVGLSSIAAAHRERRLAELTLERNTIPLPSQWPPSVDRLFLPGFAQAGSAVLFDAVWPVLVTQFGDFDGDVIVDAGRVGRYGLPEPLRLASDQILLVSRTTLPALSALRLQLYGLQAARDRTPGPDVGLLLVGPGQPYSAREVAAQLESEVVGEIPLASAEAAVLSEGQRPPNGFARSPYVKALRAGAATLAARFGTPPFGGAA